MGAQALAPKYQVLYNSATDEGIDVNFRNRRVLLSVCFHSDVVLGFELVYFNNLKFLVYFNNLKSGTRNTIRIHHLNSTEDLGAPAVAPKSQFDTFKSSDFGSRLRMGLY